MEKVFTKHDISGILPYIQQVSIMIKLSHLYGRSEHLQELSFTDSLTGLYNRRYFDIQLEEELRRSERYGLNFSLAIADIDDFKLFNDTEGHVAGDNILKQISSILIDNVRAHDILVRLGGEEFAIIMPQTRNSEAYQVAERIRKNVKERIVGFWKKFPRESLTISIGLAIYPQDGDTVIGLIERADKALYRAKREGKDRTIVFQGISKISQDDDKGLRGGLNSRLWYL